MSRKPRILFVCVENTNRSQMAEAFARIHGGGRVEASSAGSRPSGKVNPRAVAVHARGRLRPVHATTRNPSTSSTARRSTWP